MRKLREKLGQIAALTALALVGSSLPVYAQSPMQNPMPQKALPESMIGVAAAVKGDVTLTRNDAQIVGQVVESGMPILMGDVIETDAEGHLQILLLDETVFTLGPESAIIIDEFVYDPNTDAGKVSASIVKGVFRFVTGKVAQRKPEDMKVKLPSGTIGVRGTIVSGQVQGTRSMVVLNGPGPQNPVGARPGQINVSNDVGNQNPVSVNISRPTYHTILDQNLPPTPPAPTPDAILQSINSALTPQAQPNNQDEGAPQPGSASNDGQQQEDQDGADHSQGPGGEGEQGDGPAPATVKEMKAQMKERMQKAMEEEGAEKGGYSPEGEEGPRGPEGRRGPDGGYDGPHNGPHDGPPPMARAMMEGMMEGMKNAMEGLSPEERAQMNPEVMGEMMSEVMGEVMENMDPDMMGEVVLNSMDGASPHMMGRMMEHMDPKAMGDMMLQMDPAIMDGMSPDMMANMNPEAMSTMMNGMSPTMMASMMDGMEPYAMGDMMMNGMAPTMMADMMGVDPAMMDGLMMDGMEPGDMMAGMMGTDPAMMGDMMMDPMMMDYDPYMNSGMLNDDFYDMNFDTLADDPYIDDFFNDPVDPAEIDDAAQDAVNQSGQVLDGLATLADLRSLDTGTFQYSAFSPDAFHQFSPGGHRTGEMEVRMNIDFGSRTIGGGGSFLRVKTAGTGNIDASMNIQAVSFSQGSGAATFSQSNGPLTGGFDFINQGGVPGKFLNANAQYNDGIKTGGGSINGIPRQPTSGGN